MPATRTHHALLGWLVWMLVFRRKRVRRVLVLLAAATLVAGLWWWRKQRIASAPPVPVEPVTPQRAASTNGGAPAVVAEDAV
jgi:hypothetical protein